MEQLRILAYRRVSSDEQSKHGYSLDEQTERIERATAPFRKSNVIWYGGSESAVKRQRPEWRRLLRDAQAKRGDAVVFFNVSRWARSILDHKEAVPILRAYGVRLFELGKEWDLNDGRDRRRLEQEVLDAEHDPGERLEGSAAGMRRIAAKGFCIGQAPYGRICTNHAERRRADKAAWKIDPVAQKWTRRIYEWYVVKGLTLRAIYAKLQTMPRYWQETGERDPGEGTMIQRIDHRLTRAGPIKQQQLTIDEKPVVIDIVGEPIPGLLTEEEVELFRQRAEVNKRASVKKKNNPLARFVKCAACQSTMNAGPAGMYRYYVHPRERGKPVPKGCTVSVRADALEGQFFRALGTLRDLDELRKAVQAGMVSHEGPSKQELEERLASALERMHTKHEEMDGQDKLSAALVKAGRSMTGAYGARFEKNMQRLNAEVEALQREVGEIRYDLGRFDLPADFDQRVVDYWVNAFGVAPGTMFKPSGRPVLPYVSDGLGAEGKRKLAWLFFGGFTSLSKRNNIHNPERVLRNSLGVFVKRKDDNPSEPVWYAKGLIGEIPEGHHPWRAQFSIERDEDLRRVADVIREAGEKQARSKAEERVRTKAKAPVGNV